MHGQRLFLLFPWFLNTGISESTKVSKVTSRSTHRRSPFCLFSDFPVVRNKFPKENIQRPLGFWGSAHRRLHQHARLRQISISGTARVRDHGHLTKSGVLDGFSVRMSSFTCRKCLTDQIFNYYTVNLFKGFKSSALDFMSKSKWLVERFEGSL